MNTKIMFVMDLGNFLAFLAMISSVKHVSSHDLPKTTELSSKFICSFLFMKPDKML